MISDDTDIPADLRPVADKLRRQRVEPTPLELDATKRRILANSRKRESSGFMRSRATILTMLVFGLLFSTTGAGLAVNGLAGSDQASVAQYGTPTPTPTPAGATDTPTPAGSVKGGVDESPDKVLGSDKTGSDDVTTQTKQVAAAADSDQLPFTGYAAIPVLLLGLGLFAGGLVLHRGSRSVNRSG